MDKKRTKKWHKIGNRGEYNPNRVASNASKMYNLSSHEKLVYKSMLENKKRIPEQDSLFKIAKW